MAKKLNSKPLEKPKLGQNAKADATETPAKVGKPVPVIKPSIKIEETHKTDLHAISKQLAEIKDDINLMKADDKVLNDTHDRLRALEDRFYEQEVLTPLFLKLIGIADRCRQQEETKEEPLLKYLIDPFCVDEGLGGCIDKNNGPDQSMSSRKADRIEIEAFLADQGVEVFLSSNSTFLSASQRCMHSLKSTNPALHHQIAKRLLPGYRRNGKIIRREYVDVYVVSSEPLITKENSGDRI